MLTYGQLTMALLAYYKAQYETPLTTQFFNATIDDESYEFNQGLNEICKFLDDEHDPGEFLNNNKLFDLFKLIQKYPDSAEAKLLINFLDKFTNNQLDNSIIHPITTVIHMLEALNSARFFEINHFTQLNSVICQKNTLNSFSYLIQALSDFGLLHENNFNLILVLAKHANDINNSLRSMHPAGLLNSENKQENFDKLTSTPDTLLHHQLGIYFLNSQKLLSQGNFDKYIQYPFPCFIEFLNCKGKNLLTQNNLDIFFKTPVLGKACADWDRRYPYFASVDQKTLNTLIGESIDDLIADLNKNEKELSISISQSTLAFMPPKQESSNPAAIKDDLITFKR